MSTRRPDDRFLFDVFNGSGVVIGSAAFHDGKYVFEFPLQLKGLSVRHPFYVSSHPNNSQLAERMKSVALEALLKR